ncbi:MAG: hypothetical protein ACKN9Y_00080 [Bacteroidota bacterium]|nr:hypothetical protein [bacterium]
MKMLMHVFMAICLFGSVFAQDKPTGKPIFIGVHAWSRMASFSNDSRNEEHGMTFSGIPDLGLSFIHPISKKSNVGFTTDISLANYKNTYTSGANEYSRTFNYLMITPGIEVENVTLGVGIGLPMGYHRHNNTSDAEEEETWSYFQGSNQTPTVTVGDGKNGMNMVLEPRIGYSHVIMQNGGSKLHVHGHIGLMLSNVFKDEYYPTSNLQSLNGTMMSFTVGVQYLIGL